MYKQTKIKTLYEVDEPEFTVHPAIDAVSEDAIGAKLRDAFSGLLDEPVPQRFIDLIYGDGKEPKS